MTVEDWRYTGEPRPMRRQPADPPTPAPAVELTEAEIRAEYASSGPVPNMVGPLLTMLDRCGEALARKTTMFNEACEVCDGLREVVKAGLEREALWRERALRAEEKLEAIRNDMRRGRL